MGTWPRHAVLATIAFIVVASSTIGTPPSGAALAQSDEPADIREVMLDEIGGLDLTDETTEQVGTFTRQFTGAAGDLRITGFAVTTPPGAQAVFAASPTIDGLEFIEHPSLASARWVVPTGTAPGENGRSVLNFATRDHIFTIVFDATDPSFDGPGAVEAVARAQIEKAGPPSDTAAETPATETPDANTPDAGTPTELEARLSAMIPEQPPAGYGLDVAFVRLPGFSRIENDATADPGVVSFLNDRARGFTAAWKGAGLSAGVGVSKYPYEIFAASDLAQFGKLPRATIPDGAPAPPADAVVFEHDEKDRVGVAFRRGDVLVLVLADFVAPATASTATSFAIEEANLVDREVPAGVTTPYKLPTPPSKFIGLALTAAVVVAAVGGATFVARLRARRVRRAWSTDRTPDVWPDRRPGTELVQLDDDAAALRHRGAVVAVVQLVTIVVGVVALAGDFAWRGAGVAAASLVVGLVFSHFWLRHEHRLLGATAPPRAFRVPRPAGAVMGIVAFAVLGFGVSFGLKGVRYLIVNPPSLAQLRWANLLGMTPRDVGIVFASGGLVVAMLGAVLWRVARAFGRARVREVLAADPPSTGAVPALVRRRLGATADHRLGPPAALRAVLGARCRPVRGVRRLGARQLRPGGGRRSTRRPAGVARCGARAPLERHVARRDREPDARRGVDRARSRRHRRPGVGARGDRQRRTPRQDDLRVPAARADRARPSLGPHVAGAARRRGHRRRTARTVRRRAHVADRRRRRDACDVGVHP